MKRSSLWPIGVALMTLSVIFITGCEKKDDPVSTPTPEPSVSALSENELLKELNLARTNPSLYATFLEATKQYYEGNLYKVPGETPIITHEGVQAVQEAINFLSTTSSVSTMTLSTGLSKAAQDHVADTGPKGITGHTGSDGSTPDQRIERYGTWDITIGENISYGQKTARNVMIQLIVDDGISERGHRANVFKKDYHVVGFASGPHKTYGTMTVQDFAGSYKDK